jgi:hypothetical protein
MAGESVIVPFTRGAVGTVWTAPSEGATVKDLLAAAQDASVWESADVAQREAAYNALVVSSDELLEARTALELTGRQCSGEDMGRIAHAVHVTEEALKLTGRVAQLEREVYVARASAQTEFNSRMVCAEIIEELRGRLARYEPGPGLDSARAYEPVAQVLRDLCDWVREVMAGPTTATAAESRALLGRAERSYARITSGRPAQSSALASIAEAGREERSR